MRPLSEIVNDVLDGNAPSYEELRYTVYALETLLAFDTLALQQLAEAFGAAAQHQFSEQVKRLNGARSVSPKDWIGVENDPANPEFQERRRSSMALIKQKMH